MHPRLPLFVIPAIFLAAAGLGYLLWPDSDDAGKREKKTRAVPVEVAQIQQRPITLRRNFTGALEASAAFTVSAKVDGRIVELEVDLGDSISRDQLVARLDSAEYQQTVARAEADLAVARANLAEARSLLVIAERELQRLDNLSKQGVSSVSQRDVAKADQLAKAAHVQVSEAQVTRARAELAAARIRLDYTQVRAAWQGGGEKRVIAERFLDEGETVTANEPLLRIVELDPVIAVFFVTERDYARLHPQQVVELVTDVYPDDVFNGRISRIAPVFDEGTRQARVEVSVPNGDAQLKPGMYIRARVVLETVKEAAVVPEQALATRDEVDGVFVIAPGSERVSWRPVRPGIREAGMVQVTGEGLHGRVVTLGQQLLDDGSAVIISGMNVDKGSPE